MSFEYKIVKFEDLNQPKSHDLDIYENEKKIDTDEELTNLITLEAAFGASARVLNAVQRAFDEVINIL